MTDQSDCHICGGDGCRAGCSAHDLQTGLRRFLHEWKRGFGDGCVAFDNGYFDAQKQGASWPGATRKGCHALLDAFVEAYEQEAARAG